MSYTCIPISKQNDPGTSTRNKGNDIDPSVPALKKWKYLQSIPRVPRTDPMGRVPDLLGGDLGETAAFTKMVKNEIRVI